MATKKTTTKKAPAKKAPVAKKAATKVTKKSKSTQMGIIRKHVGLRPEETDFFTFRITRQTVYWLVLGVVVIMFTLWIMRLQADIQTLYDQIDAATVESVEL